MVQKQARQTPCVTRRASGLPPSRRPHQAQTRLQRSQRDISGRILMYRLKIRNLSYLCTHFYPHCVTSQQFF